MMSCVLKELNHLFDTNLYSIANIPPERDEIKVVQDDFAAKIHLRSEIPFIKNRNIHYLIKNVF